MIVTCPACDTRYLVDDATLGGAEGRRLRCASCGNVWQYSPEAAAIRAAIAEAAADAAANRTSEPVPSGPPPETPRPEPPRPEPRLEPQPHPAGPGMLSQPAIEIAHPRATRRRRTWAGGIAALVIVAAIVLIAIFGRDRIVALWPASAPVYTALHLAEPPGTGLEVTVTPTRTTDALVINGDIVNNAAVTRRIPRLRVTLRDGNKTDLDARIIDPPVASLPPGATAHFATTFEHPSITATGVAVTFASQ